LGRETTVAMSGFEVSEDAGGDEDIDQRDLEENIPTEFHQLVEAEAREGPAHPEEEENDRGHFGEEGADIDQPPEPSVRSIRNEGQAPSAEEERHDDARAGDHGRVFTEEEKGETHRRIFRVVAADEFLLGLGQVEGHAVGFGEHGDHEDYERNHHGDPEERFFQAQAENRAALRGHFERSGSLSEPRGENHPSVLDLILHDDRG